MQPPKLIGKHQVQSSIDIDAKQQAVWQVMRDFANVYRWAPSVIDSHSLTVSESGEGAGRHCKLEGFGEIDEYVTFWQEQQGFVYDVTPLGPLDKSFSSWWLEPIDDNRTRLTVTFSYNLRFGLFGVIMHRLLMRRKLQQSLPDTLKAFKKRVETGIPIRHHRHDQALA